MGCDVSSIITQGCSKTREPWAVGRNTFGVQAALFALVITFITQAAHAENYENVRAALKDADTKTRASDFTGAHVALDAAIAMKGITSTELYSAHYKKAYVFERQKKPEDAAKEYVRARAVIAKALETPELTVRQRVDWLRKRAATYEKERKYPLARADFLTIATDKEVDANTRFDGSKKAAYTYLREGKFGKGREAYRKLLKTPGLDAAKRFSVAEAVASSYVLEGRLDKGEAAYRELLTHRDRSEANGFNIYSRLSEIHFRRGNLKAGRSAIEKMMPLAKEPSHNKWRLQALIRLALTRNATSHVIFACSHLLKLPKLNVATRVTNIRHLADALLAEQKSDQAKKILSEAVDDEKLPAASRFRFDVLLTGLTVGWPSSADSASLEKAKINLTKAVAVTEQKYKDTKLSAADKLAALDGAAKSLTRLHRYDLARAFNALADRLLADRPVKKYVCRYHEKAPLGAAGWTLSNLLNDENYRESRFEDYNSADAARLITDVSAERIVSKDARKKFYFDNTAFYMLHDRRGWHMFVLSGEENLEDILADGTKAGSLEMYFTTGPGQPYHQWIINLPSGEVSGHYDWHSPHRSFRSLKDSFKTETITFGSNIGTYIFIPWETLYDKLPFDTPSQWRFGFIRWSRAGGLTWGGKVHEIARWGLIEWEKPAEEQVTQIRRDIARKAWGKYKSIRDELGTHWQHSQLGDADFYKSHLKPKVDQLNALGKGMEEPSKLTARQVQALFKKAMPDWMEFRYVASELRREYLEEVFFGDRSPSEPEGAQQSAK
jgi:hypothetical protein